MTNSKPFYFTFGVDFPLADYVQRVDAVSEDEARRGMFEYYGSKWAFCYHGKDCDVTDNGRKITVGLRSRYTYTRIEKIIIVDALSGEIYCNSTGGLAE